MGLLTDAACDLLGVPRGAGECRPHADMLRQVLAYADARGLRRGDRRAIALDEPLRAALGLRAGDVEVRLMGAGAPNLRSAVSRCLLPAPRAVADAFFEAKRARQRRFLQRPPPDLERALIVRLVAAWARTLCDDQRSVAEGAPLLDGLWDAAGPRPVDALRVHGADGQRPRPRRRARRRCRSHARRGAVNTGIRREKLRGGGGGRTDRMRSVFGGVTDY